MRNSIFSLVHPLVILQNTVDAADDIVSFCWNYTLYEQNWVLCALL